MLFHWFVQAHFGASDIDWSEIFPENFPSNDFAIDAGFVTPSEYHTALYLLANDPYTPDLRERTFHCSGLILLYRFGARQGK